MASRVLKMRTTESLLRDVITRQAGDPMKGILEMIQNAIDAIRARRREKSKFKAVIEVSVQDASGEHVQSGPILEVSDNGIGIGATLADIQSNFGDFGDSGKAGDDGFIGAMGMGRGQAMCLALDRERGEIDGDIEVRSRRLGANQGWKLHGFSLADLSFKAASSKCKTGTKWTIRTERKSFDAFEIARYIRESVMVEFDIVVNGKRVNRDLSSDDCDVFEDCDDFTIAAVKDSGGFRLYERGLFVRTEDMLPGFAGVILVHRAMKLDMSRTQILDGDVVWEEVKEGIFGILDQEIAKIAAKPKTALKLNPDERKGIVQRTIASGKSKGEWSALRLVKLANGKKMAFGEALLASESGRLFYSGDDDRAADKVIQQGVAVIDINDPVTRWLSENGIINLRPMEKSEAYDRVVKKPTKIVKTKVREEDFLKAVADVFAVGRDLRVGESDTALGWTDGRNYIAIERGVIKGWMKTAKESGVAGAMFSVVDLLSHEMAHDDNNERTDVHGYDFDKAEVRMLHRNVKKLQAWIVSGGGVGAKGGKTKKQKDERRAKLAKGIPYHRDVLSLVMKRKDVITIAGILGLKKIFQMGSTENIIEAVLEAQAEQGME